MKTRLLLFMLICLITGAFVNASLEVKSIDFELSDLGEETFTSSGTYDHKVKPGREFTMNVKVCNEFDKDANNSHIEEIDFRVVIEDIDDSSDYEADDIREFDLRGDRCEDVKIEFDDGNRIPVEFEDDASFNVYVDGAGVLENGTTIVLDSFNFTLEGELQDKDVGLTRVRLDEPRLSCDKTNEVYFTVHNWGKEDIDEAEVLVYSKQLEIEAKKTFSLKEGTGSNSRRSDKIEFNIPEQNWRDGDYKIEVTPRTGPTPSTNENDNTVDLIVTLSGCDNLRKEVEKQKEKDNEEVEELEEKTQDLEKEKNELEEEKEKLEEAKKELEEQLSQLQEEQAEKEVEEANELSFNISELEQLEQSSESTNYVPFFIAGLFIVLLALIVLVYLMFKD